MKKPIIHAYTIAFNEEVLMPHFLKHYTSFCESVFVYDNFSTDKTIDICSKYENVEVFNYGTNNQIRDDIYLKLKNEVWKKSKGKADFVIVCDVDEFVYHPSLISILQHAYSEQVSVIRCEGYNMFTKVLPLESNILFKDFQYGTREKNFDKALIFNPNLIDEINYDFGAHNCCPVGKVRYNNFSIALLHYKFITLGYLINRYKLFESRLSSYNKKLKLGYHYSHSRFKITREFNFIKNNSQNIIEKYK